jgi:hypothetical protein
MLAAPGRGRAPKTCKHREAKRGGTGRSDAFDIICRAVLGRKGELVPASGPRLSYGGEPGASQMSFTRPPPRATGAHSPSCEKLTIYTRLCSSTDLHRAAARGGKSEGARAEEAGRLLHEQRDVQQTAKKAIKSIGRWVIAGARREG